MPNYSYISLHINALAKTYLLLLESLLVLLVASSLSTLPQRYPALTIPTTALGLKRQLWLNYIPQTNH